MSDEMKWRVTHRHTEVPFYVPPEEGGKQEPARKGEASQDSEG